MRKQNRLQNAKELDPPLQDKSIFFPLLKHWKRVKVAFLTEVTQKKFLLTLSIHFPTEWEAILFE